MRSSAAFRWVWVLCLVVLLADGVLAQSLPGVPSAPAPGEESSLGSLSGRVQSSGKKRALQGATVQLETGQSATTDAQGGFVLGDIAPGDHTVRISCKGYRTANGKVHIEAGATRSLLVDLKREGSSGTSGQGGKTTTLWIEAYTASNYGRGRAWVSKIEVWEWGNSRRYWTNSWWSDAGDTYRSLSCPGARLNKDYEIAVTWTIGKGGYTKRTVFQRKLWAAGQVERFYHP